MRKSVKYQPTNAWIVSIQLNKETFDKLNAMCQATGMSRSKIVKILIASSKINRSARSEGNPGE